MTEPDRHLSPTTESGPASEEPGATRRTGLAVSLFAATLLSTTYIGSQWEGGRSLWDGLVYSLPLMTILLAHELGHYVAARIHRVPATLPYFIPMPIPPLGTMGAVILMPGQIRSRNALLDVGAAGPLAGMCVALPVLIYGIATSPVLPEPTVPYLMEGRSLLYVALLLLIKGPFPEGHDIHLTPTAFAGWAGLLVTMINLIPALQLDGGHVAHALWGERHERISKWVRLALFPLGLLVSLGFGLSAYAQGKVGDALMGEATGGMQWIVWGVLLWFLRGRSSREHPATDGAPLSPGRKRIARLTLVLFVLLFMPSWLREVVP